MGLPFPTDVGLSEQRSVVKRLDKVVEAVEAMRSEQESTADDLAALFPSLIDRACHGELQTGGGTVSLPRVAAAD